MISMTYAPTFWRDESSGARVVVEKYLSGLPLMIEDITIIRNYFRQWINAPAFSGEAVDELRERVDRVLSLRGIDLWLEDAFRAGVVPI